MEKKEKQNLIEINNKKNILEEDFQKKLEKNKFIIMTPFKKVKNQHSTGIIRIIKHHKRIINDSLKQLKSGENDINNRIKHKRFSQLKDLTNSKSCFNIPHMSPGCQTLMKKIRFKINKIKKSHEDLTALNSLFLDNTNSIQENNKNNSNYFKIIS